MKIGGILVVGRRCSLHLRRSRSRRGGLMMMCLGMCGNKVLRVVNVGGSVVFGSWGKGGGRNVADVVRVMRVKFYGLNEMKMKGNVLMCFFFSFFSFFWCV